MSHVLNEVFSKDPEKPPLDTSPAQLDGEDLDSVGDDGSETNDSSKSNPRVNPFLRFAFDAPRKNQSQAARSPTSSGPGTRIGKRKHTLDATENEEKHKPKIRRTAAPNESSPKPSSSSKVKFYEHLRGLDDCLEAGLDVVFCGINPGKQSAEIGHHYGNPTNHFWSCLHESGLTSRRLDPREDASLPSQFSIGLVNLTDRPTVEQSELSTAEQVAGVTVLLDKVAQYRPRLLCFVGLGIADIVKSKAVVMGASGAGKPIRAKEKAAVGLQPYKMVHSGSIGIQETLFFAVSSTSGRVVRYQKSDKVHQFQDLHNLLIQLKSGVVDTTAIASLQHSVPIT